MNLAYVVLTLILAWPTVNSPISCGWAFPPMLCFLESMKKHQQKAETSTLCSWTLVPRKAMRSWRGGIGEGSKWRPQSTAIPPWMCMVLSEAETSSLVWCDNIEPYSALSHSSVGERLVRRSLPHHTVLNNKKTKMGKALPCLQAASWECLWSGLRVVRMKEVFWWCLEKVEVSIWTGPCQRYPPFLTVL